MQTPASASACSPSTSFAILGPVQVTVEGEPVRLGGPRQVAVLARLLLSRGQVVSMDQLVESVWPGDVPARPAVTVRSYISNLRRIIEPDRLRGDRSSCIESRHPGYRLMIAPAQVDAVRFEQLVVEGRRALAGRDPGAAVALLTEALQLWRGEPCAGVLASDAVVAFRARLGELHSGAGEALFEARLDLGDHDGVIPDLEVAMARDPLREHLTELAMRALYAAGRQSDALTVCRQLRRRLVDELGVDPGPRIQELERRILVHDPTLASGRVDREQARPDRVAHDVAGGAGPPPVVGRDRELATLAALASGLTAGRGAVALITGEPGSGKTSLVQQLDQWLGSGPVTVAWGRSRAVARHRPLWPWTQLLDQLGRQLGPDLDRSLLAGPTSLTGLSPYLAARLGDGEPAPAPPEDDTEAIRYFQPVVELLRRLSDRHPLLLVIDDAHWADTASLELLVHAGAALAGAQVGFVVTWRHTEPVEPGSRRALRALSRLPSVARLELGGIDVAAAVGMVTAAGGDAELARRLHWASAGNPHLIELLLDASAGGTAAGAVDAASDDRERRDGDPLDLGGLPPPSANLADVVLDRVDRLGPAAPEVLAVAALAVRSLSADVVARAGGWQPALVDDVLDRAVEAGLLVGGPDRSYLFVHPVARVVLAGQLPAPRRARYHAAIGHALWRLGGRPAELAHHFSLAGSAGTTVLAARFALEASLALTDPAELAVVVRAATAGLAAADRLARTEGLDVELAIVLTHAARLQGDVDRFRQLGARALEAAERAGRPDQLAKALLAVTGPDPGAAGLAGVDFLGLRPDPDDVLAAVEGVLGRIDPDHPARELLDVRRRGLLGLAGRAGPIEVVAEARPKLGAGATIDLRPSAAPSPGRGAEAAERLPVDLELARSAALRWPAGDRLELADRLCHQARALRWARPAVAAARLRLGVHLERGSASAALATLAAARSWLAPDDGLSRLELDTLEIDLALLQGRLTDAEPRITSGRGRARSAGLDPSTFDRRLAALRWISGDLDQAEQLLLTVHGGPGAADAIDRLVIGAALAAERGEIEAARRRLDVLVATARWPRTISGAPSLERAALVAAAAAAARHRPAALVVHPLLAGQAAALVTDDRGTVAAGPAAHPAALAAMALGLVADARRLLDEAERRGRSVRAGPSLVRILAARASLTGDVASEPATRSV